MIQSLINKDKVAILNKITDLIIKKENPRNYYLENNYLIDVIGPFEVFSIEAFQNNDYTISEIKAIAGKLINLFRNSLLNFNFPKNNFLIKLDEESNKIKERFNHLKLLIKEENYEALKDNFEFLDEIKKRIFKIQNIVFPIIEKKFTYIKPLQVMWSLYDDVDNIHNKILNSLNNNLEDLNNLLGHYFFLVLGLLDKEQLLLLPAFSCLVNNDTIESLIEEANLYGYAFISEGIKSNTQSFHSYADHLFQTNNGKLSFEELISILSKWGDITFVDKNNKVKFFNTPFNHFHRSSSIIGRDVHNCHPEKSIHIVDEIITKFRNGTENRADFWINLKDELIMISYFAIRNENNEYLGVLEVTQDISKITQIKGEKRLLDFK